jgi:hypothetical protein
VSKTVSLDGRVQRGIGDGCGLFGLAQGGGIIRHRGGVDGRPGEGLRYFFCTMEMARGIVVEVTSGA